MIFEQVFYGRGPQGYAVLGDSGCSYELVAHAEMLCQQHGTPDAALRNPFLFQHISCGRIYMGCGMAGQKDGLGRSTLFFHVLIGEAESFRSAGLSAVDFFRHGLFAKVQEDRKLEALDVNVQGLQIERGNSTCPIDLPAVVMFKGDDSIKVLDLIGGMRTQVNWTTYSWNTSNSFAYIGIPSSKSIDSVPFDYNVYDECGRLLRHRQGGGRKVEGMLNDIGGAEKFLNARQAPDEARQTGNGVGNGRLPMLFFGLGVGLLIGMFVAGGLRLPAVKESRSDKWRDSSTPVIKFDENYRIRDFREALVPLGWEDNLGNTDSRSSAFLKKCKVYVDFVNKYFPQGK